MLLSAFTSKCCSPGKTSAENPSFRKNVKNSPRVLPSLHLDTAAPRGESLTNELRRHDEAPPTDSVFSLLMPTASKTLGMASAAPAWQQAGLPPYPIRLERAVTDRGQVLVAVGVGQMQETIVYLDE